ncbi:MAG: IlvD/Edd family dehydratase [Kiloniellales bacterium]
MAKSGRSGLRTNLTSYGDEAFSLFLRKAFIKAMGYSDDALDRPIVGIANTASGFNACHQTVPLLVEAVKRGVMQAGGLAIDFPTISLHESFAHPTSMLYRNLMAMDTEEMLTAQPMDAVVLIGGCDKTVPAQLMAAASANIPTIMEVVGPMITGSHRGERLGACTDCRRFWGRYRGGEIDDKEIEEISGRLAPSAGTCMVMGTASTMACVTEALGMMLPGGACVPAVLADRLRHAEASGRRAVALAAAKLLPAQIMTPEAFSNALRVLLAIGGSTNALIHLTAVAGRRGIRIDLESLDRMSRETPVLVDLKPSGTQYMEDLHRAGGLAPILRELKELLHLDCLTVSGRTLGAEIEAAQAAWEQSVIRPKDAPVHQQGGLAVLFGNLAPRGAIIKQSSAAPELQIHEGRAVVFDSLDDLAARIDDPALDVAAEDVLVLRNAGPKGAPGMPEAGYIPIPRKLALQGVRDMVRISDARMSGTAFGTVVLHVTPEAAIGGPLARVRSGDRIRLDVPKRLLDLLVEPEELAVRPVAPEPDHGIARGYKRLHLDHILQADEGCDLDFLVAAPTSFSPLY